MEYYCNSPVIISQPGFTKDAYFPTLVLVLNTASTTDQEMCAECHSTDNVLFDISEYSRGLLYGQSITPTSAPPSVTINYSFKHRWTKKGVTTDEPVAGTNSITIRIGRGDIRNSSSTATTFKPTTTEVVNVGDHVVNGGVVVAGTSTEGVVAGTSMYAENNPNRHQICFLNSFGRWETASVIALEAKQYDFTTSSETVTRMMPDNLSRPDMISHTELNSVTWKMSSGYVTEEWAEWFAYEVLSAEIVFMRTGSTWTPVTLKNDTNVAVYNRAKNGLCNINFNLKFK